MDNTSDVNNENDKQRKEDLERLESFRLMDDTYARTYFRKHPELAEFVLRIIMGIDDLKIDPSKYETQYDAKRIAGSKSVVLDVVAGDTSGREFDIEVENWDAEPERGEYHLATMCVENLHQGQEFKDLPETYVIFICDGNPIGSNKPVNQFSFRDDDLGVKDEDAEHKSLKGKTHIIYVNGNYNDETTDIGKLIHDFKCLKSSEMYFPLLADRTRYLKETPEGVELMCRVMDQLRLETEKKTATEIARNFLKLKNVTHEQIAEATGLTLEEVKALAGQAAS